MNNKIIKRDKTGLIKQLKTYQNKKSLKKLLNNQLGEQTRNKN